MSITSSDPTHSAIVHTAAGRACFYCGEPTTDPAVHWMGATGDIYLHPDCVGRLFVPMVRDVHEIQKPDYYARQQAAGRAEGPCPTA